jgi:hypothetical protein
MAHDAALKEKAKEMFVVNGFSMDTIQTMLPEVSRKSLYNWRNSENWEEERRSRVTKTANRRERIENQIDKALDELDVKLDPKLIFALGKLVAALKLTSTFEFTEEKSQKDYAKKKGLSEETLKEIEEKILGL